MEHLSLNQERVDQCLNLGSIGCTQKMSQDLFVAE